MERTPEEIMLGLTRCLSSGQDSHCVKCPYYEVPSFGCQTVLREESIALIHQLIKQNRTLAEIKESYEQVISRQERENAAMMETLKRMAHSGGVCIGCVHMDDEPTILEHCEDLDFDCEKCPSPCACHSCKEGSNYTWSGVDSNKKTT